jgi:hypothetical protein
VRLGLVEEQDVGGEDQARRERDELALAAAERARRTVELAVGEAEVAQVADRFALDPVGPERLALLEHARLALEHALHAVEVGGERGIGELRLDAREVGLHGGEVRPRGADRLADGALVAGHELREVGDDRAAAQGDGAGVGLVAAREQAQERGLPRPVRADQADPRSGRQLEVESVEDSPAAEGLHDAARAQGEGSGGGGHGHDPTVTRCDSVAAR